MSKSRMLWLFPALALLLVTASSHGQSSSNSFSAFYKTFKTAVQQKDTGALAGLMSSRFDFIFSTNVPAPAVFDGLASNGGQQMSNLQQAVQGTPVPYSGAGPYQGARVLPCTPSQVIYNCLVVFKRNSQGQWQWRAMVMPTR